MTRGAGIAVAVFKGHCIEQPMNPGARLLIVAGLLIFAGTAFEGCRAVRGVASMIRGGANQPKPGTKTTTTTTVVTRTTRTTASDVTAPEHPSARSSPTQQRPGRLIGTSSEAASPTPVSKVSRKETARGKKAPQKPASPSATSAQTEYPTAKPVPAKPGYVFSPFDPKGRYVDVSGYTPGSKVKDPWTDKIFVVP
jgi:hypothetical protein